MHQHQRLFAIDTAKLAGNAAFLDSLTLMHIRNLHADSRRILLRQGCSRNGGRPCWTATQLMAMHLCPTTFWGPGGCIQVAGNRTTKRDAEQGQTKCMSV